MSVPPFKHNERDSSTIDLAALVKAAEKHRRPKEDDRSAPKIQGPEGVVAPTPADTASGTTPLPLYSSQLAANQDVADWTPTATPNSGQRSSARPSADAGPATIGTAVGASILAALLIAVVFLVRGRRWKAVWRGKSSAQAHDRASPTKRSKFPRGFKFWNKPIVPAPGCADDKMPWPLVPPALRHPKTKPKESPQKHGLLKPPATAVVTEPRTRSMYSDSWQVDAEGLLPETDFPEFFSPKARRVLLDPMGTDSPEYFSPKARKVLLDPGGGERPEFFSPKARKVLLDPMDGENPEYFSPKARRVLLDPTYR